MRERTMLGGSGAATAGALVTLAAVDNRTIDRAADLVLLLALLALSRAAFRLVDASDDARARRESSRRRRPVERP